MLGGASDVISSFLLKNDEIEMPITGEILKILMHFFFESIMTSSHLSFKRNNKKIWSGITSPLMKS